ncbi:MAG: hypothetical protein AB7F59_04080 [Bdellovibrionales bacterium]
MLKISVSLFLLVVGFTFTIFAQDPDVDEYGIPIEPNRRQTETVDPCDDSDPASYLACQEQMRRRAPASNSRSLPTGVLPTVIMVPTDENSPSEVGNGRSGSRVDPNNVTTNNCTIALICGQKNSGYSFTADQCERAQEACSGASTNKSCENIAKKFEEYQGKAQSCSVSGTSSIQSCANLITQCSQEINRLQSSSQQGQVNFQALSPDCKTIALSQNKEDLQKLRDKFEKEIEKETDKANELSKEMIKSQGDQEKAIRELAQKELNAKKDFRKSQDKLYDLRERDDQRFKTFLDATEKLDEELKGIESEKRNIEVKIVELKIRNSSEIAKINDACAMKARADAAKAELDRQKTLTDSSSGVRVDGGIGELAAYSGKRGTAKSRVKRKEAIFRDLCLFDTQNQVKALEEGEKAMLQVIENQKKDFDTKATLLKDRLTNLAKTLDRTAATDYERAMFNYIQDAEDYTIAQQLSVQARTSSLEQAQKEQSMLNQQIYQSQGKLQQAQSNLSMIPELSGVSKTEAEDFKKAKEGLSNLRGLYESSYNTCCTTAKKAKRKADQEQYNEFCRSASQAYSRTQNPSSSNSSRTGTR